MPEWLIGFGFGFLCTAIIATIFGAIINHFLAKNRSRQEREIRTFNKAAQSFREAFIPNLTAAESSYEIGGTEIYHFLKQALTHNYDAFTAFKEYLSPSDRIGLETTWEKYRYPQGPPEKDPEQVFWDYISDSFEKIETKKRKLAAEKIRDLLKFAEIK